MSADWATRRGAVQCGPGRLRPGSIGGSRLKGRPEGKKNAGSSKTSGRIELISSIAASRAVDGRRPIGHSPRDPIAGASPGASAPRLGGDVASPSRLKEHRMSRPPDRQTLRTQLGKALRRLRERRGLTSVEVARRLGMKGASSGQISRWERGRCSPRLDAVWRYMDAVGASLSDLERELVPRKSNPRLRQIAAELRQLAPLGRERGGNGRDHQRRSCPRSLTQTVVAGLLRRRPNARLTPPAESSYRPPINFAPEQSDPCPFPLSL